jgi:tetratricopeptide (TPR) repeat protein
MEQVTDPPAFERTFRDRINEAIAGTKPNVRSLESFATLQELAIINPRYPNIDRIIRQAKIDMGMIPPDPDPRAIARSNELTRLARSIIDAQNSVQYQVALAQLDEAILLNSDNNNAVIAKDILLTRMTGTGVIVLDSNSRDEYDEALLQLQQGNYINAMAIVQRLLQNPKNRNSTQILDLQRRIESLL